MNDIARLNEGGDLRRSLHPAPEGCTSRYPAAKKPQYSKHTSSRLIVPVVFPSTTTRFAVRVIESRPRAV